MKDYKWKVKVSDLLNNPGTQDEFSVENKFIKTEDFVLDKKWIKGKVEVISLNPHEIKLKIKELEFTLIYKCDFCLGEYTQDFKLENLDDVLFVNSDEIKLEEKIHDDIFEIDMKNQQIDLSELVEMIVKLQEPFVKKCEKCKSSKNSSDSKSQEEISSYKIDFSQLLKS